MSNEEIVELLQNCGKCYTAGSRLLKEFEADDEIRLTKPRCQAITLLVRHQIEVLDAAVALTKIGRPHLIGAVRRGAYESYLNILGIGWLKKKIGKVTYSPAYNARRFIAFRNLVVARFDDKIESVAEAWVRLGVPAQEAKRRRALLLRRAYPSAIGKHHQCFGKDAKSWFHDGGVTGLSGHLWPESGTPCFPEPLFRLGGGYSDWKELFGHFWGHDSAKVHADVVGLTSRTDDEKGKWPSHEPIGDFSDLASTWSLVFMSLFAAADALHRLPALNLVVRACDADASAAGKYLPSASS